MTVQVIINCLLFMVGVLLLILRAQDFIFTINDIVLLMVKVEKPVGVHSIGRYFGVLQPKVVRVNFREIN